jgi:hypothetical protein
MRSFVTFCHPAPFEAVSEEDGVLSVGGADWFVALLKRIDGLAVRTELIQEDWGVVLRAERSGQKFWIGLSMGPDTDAAWLAHIHHGSFAWFQWFSAAGKRALWQLASDLHQVLAAEPSVSDVTWYRERDMAKPRPLGAPTPDGV